MGLENIGAQHFQKQRSRRVNIIIGLCHTAIVEGRVETKFWAPGPKFKPRMGFGHVNARLAADEATEAEVDQYCFASLCVNQGIYNANVSVGNAVLVALSLTEENLFKNLQNCRKGDGGAMVFNEPLMQFHGGIIERKLEPFKDIVESEPVGFADWDGFFVIGESDGQMI